MTFFLIRRFYFRISFIIHDFYTQNLPFCHSLTIWHSGCHSKNESSNLKPCSKEAERIQLIKWKIILFFKFGTRDKPYQVTTVQSIVRTSVVPG